MAGTTDATRRRDRPSNARRADHSEEFEHIDTINIDDPMEPIPSTGQRARKYPCIRSPPPIDLTAESDDDVEEVEQDDPELDELFRQATQALIVKLKHPSFKNFLPKTPTGRLVVANTPDAPVAEEKLDHPSMSPISAIDLSKPAKPLGFGPISPVKITHSAKRRINFNVSPTELSESARRRQAKAAAEEFQTSPLHKPGLNKKK